MIFEAGFSLVIQRKRSIFLLSKSITDRFQIYGDFKVSGNESCILTAFNAAIECCAVANDITSRILHHLKPMIALFLLALTVIITMLAWFVVPKWQFQGMLKPYEAWRHGKWYQLVTSGFLHANGTHLLVNMFVFFFFGPVLEQAIGASSFLILYFTALVVSSLPTLIQERNNPRYASLGASGAVEAVLFGYIVMFPLNKIYFIFIPVGIPAIIFGGLFLAYSYYESRQRRDNVNHVAHIAGAIYGAVYTLLFVPDAFSRFLGHFGF